MGCDAHDCPNTGPKLASLSKSQLQTLAAAAIDLKLLLRCSSCRDYYHPDCIEASKTIPDDLRDSWQCPHCVHCTVCHTGENENCLLQCDGCDRGFHTFCLTPPLNRPPNSRWLCSRCVICLSCGSRSASKWCYNMTMCVTCHGRYNKGHYCPQCSLVHPPGARDDLVRCRKCSYFTHSHCVDATCKQIDAVFDPETFNCANCLRKAAKQAEKKEKEMAAAAAAVANRVSFASSHAISPAKGTPVRSASSKLPPPPPNAFSLFDAPPPPLLPHSSSGGGNGGGSSSTNSFAPNSSSSLSLSAAAGGEQLQFGDKSKRKRLSTTQPIDLQFLLANYRFRFLGPTPTVKSLRGGIFVCVVYLIRESSLESFISLSVSHTHIYSHTILLHIIKIPVYHRR